jgi:hypothetical protein
VLEVLEERETMVEMPELEPQDLLVLVEVLPVMST